MPTQSRPKQSQPQRARVYHAREAGANAAVRVPSPSPRARWQASQTVETRIVLWNLFSALPSVLGQPWRKRNCKLQITDRYFLIFNLKSEI